MLKSEIGDCSRRQAPDIFLRTQFCQVLRLPLFNLFKLQLQLFSRISKRKKVANQHYCPHQLCFSKLFSFGFPNVWNWFFVTPISLNPLALFTSLNAIASPCLSNSVRQFTSCKGTRLPLWEHPCRISEHPASPAPSLQQRKPRENRASRQQLSHLCRKLLTSLGTVLHLGPTELQDFHYRKFPHHTSFNIKWLELVKGAS